MWCLSVCLAVCLRPQIEEENAALLAALTDSLDGMVEDEVGGLSVFPSLADGPEDDEDDVDEDARRDRLCPSELQHEQRSLVDTELFGSSPGSEPEDPSLVRTLPSCFRWMWMWMGLSIPSAGV